MFALSLMFIRQSTLNQQQLGPVDIRECKLVKGKMECVKKALAKGSKEEVSYYLTEDL